MKRLTKAPFEALANGFFFSKFIFIIIMCMRLFLMCIFSPGHLWMVLERRFCEHLCELRLAPTTHAASSSSSSLSSSSSSSSSSMSSAAAIRDFMTLTRVPDEKFALVCVHVCVCACVCVCVCVFVCGGGEVCSCNARTANETSLY